MKKVLYLTNIEVPYRVRFFNELANYCDLTVLYERRKSKNRDKSWATSEQSQYHTEYLDGVNISNENSFSLKILKYITGEYDAIIVGCCNSPVQIMAVLLMKALDIRYYMNIDGEIHLNGAGLKSKLKKLILSGAQKYLVAGKKAGESLQSISGNAQIIPYFFSSLSDEELRINELKGKNTQRNDTILVVGQYFDYKGMDIALDVARMDKSIHYKLVGMGKRTELFIKEQCADTPPNVDIIPFLQKEELEKAYTSCAMLLLPSRKECWGLVINEAASFATPIVSTWGSGAAIELIGEDYPQYLAKPDNAKDLFETIQRLRNSSDTAEYGAYLMKKNKDYSIEKSVQIHLQALGIL